ncbi:hypothetical protein F5Y08DRAFT_348128 [Xylaria arbuscula]|nr:hypothetical protein F5Y08DRAFT_348128 [Xylaria arbuscula]
MHYRNILFGLTYGIGAYAGNAPHGQVNRRDTYPINCHLHGWPSADVDSIKQAYSWFYELWAPLEADAQQCRRVACFGTSAVWLCADSLGFKKENSVKIADKMNDLLDGDHGCLDAGDKTKVQGMQFTGEEWRLVYSMFLCSIPDLVDLRLLRYLTP